MVILEYSYPRSKVKNAKKMARNFSFAIFSILNKKIGKKAEGYF